MSEKLNIFIKLDCIFYRIKNNLNNYLNMNLPIQSFKNYEINFMLKIIRYKNIQMQESDPDIYINQLQRDY